MCSAHERLLFSKVKPLPDGLLSKFSRALGLGGLWGIHLTGAVDFFGFDKNEQGQRGQGDETDKPEGQFAGNHVGRFAIASRVNRRRNGPASQLPQRCETFESVT